MPGSTLAKLDSALIRSTVDAIVAFDTAGRITRWNPAATRLYGFPAERVLGQPIETLGVGAESTGPRTAPDAPPSDADHVRFDATRRTADGRTIEVAVSRSAIRGTDGTLVGWCEIARDITERRWRERRLLTETSVVRVLALAETLTAAAPRMLQLICESEAWDVGVLWEPDPRREELRCRSIWSADSSVPAAFIKALRGMRFARGQGLPGRVWQSGTPEVIPDITDHPAYLPEGAAPAGGLHSALGIPLRRGRDLVAVLEFFGRQARDPDAQLLEMFDAIGSQIALLLQRRRAEEQLRQAYREVSELKTALDEHSIVATTDPRGRITYVNDKFCAVSKYPREELLGQDHRIINSGYHSREFFRNLWSTISSGKVWHGEIRNRAKDGSHYWVDTTIVPFLDERGRPRQYIAIRTEITEPKRAQEILRQRTEELARSNQNLEQFAYVASHDLQEPLRAVAGCVQILQRRYGGKLDERADELIRHAVDGASRMKRLIDDLLDFSRVGRHGKPLQDIPCDDIVDAALQNLAVAIQESGAVIVREPLPHVRADGGQLGRVFQNLIANGLKFRRHETPRIEIRARRGEHEWILSVRDNGIGIEPEYHDRIFGIFQRLHTRTEYPGTGIGLALSRRIIERHGGRIWVESTPGEGSTFLFTLPDAR